MTNNENREYLERVKEEIVNYYNGFEDENGEERSLYDYLADVLDYAITIDSHMDYESCKVWITLGGPDIWIDTAENELDLAWGCDRDSLYLGYEICDAIDDILAELYYNR